MRSQSKPQLGGDSSAVDGDSPAPTDVESPVSELEALREAIDNVDQGIVVIDRNLVVQFVNRKARVLWLLTPEQCDHRPTFGQFIYDIAATGIYDVPEGELADYVMRRFSMVQRGDPTPIDVRIKGNRIIRAQCTLLPSGSRMLTHTDVTDLVHRAEHNGRLANVDVLTGLPNRRSFLESAEIEWDRFHRYKQPFSLMALDLDGLKQINDQFGHEMGDRAIRRIAEICEFEKRASDVVARLGGDEFAILMPGTGEMAAQNFAERLSQSISAKTLDTESIHLSVGWGIAQANLDMRDFAELMKLADDRLYEAKRASRNFGIRTRH